MIKEDYLLIGYIIKPHGKAGQVVIRLNGDFGDELEPGEPLFLEIDETMVPFFIEEVEAFADKAFVKLEFLESVEEIRQFNGSKVYFKTTEKLQSLFITGTNSSEYVGYKVTDDTSSLSGTITGIINTPANPLFELINSAKKFYIPIQADLIVSIDKKSKCIRMKLPEGFADI